MKYMFIDRRGAAAIWGLVNHIATALLAEGNEVTFCRLGDGREIKEPPPPSGVELVEIEVPSKTHVWDIHCRADIFASGFRPLLRKIRPDVVHTHFCVPGVVARLAARQEGVPIIVSTQHELLGSMYPQYRWAVRLTERCSDAIVYVSRTVADSFRRTPTPLHEWTDDDGRHVVIHNGVDMEKIHSLGSATPSRDPLKIVCSGRMVQEKGHAVLLKAMPRVLRHFPDAHLLLVGSGPREDALRQLAVERGLGGQVDFVGWLPHERALQEVVTAGATVVPSSGPEGFGLVVAEAMACSTPVIASDIPAFREIADTGPECMYFFEKKNSEALAERICRVLKNPGEASRRTALARERVELCFSAKRMVGEYLKLYDLLASRRLEVSCV